MQKGKEAEKQRGRLKCGVGGWGLLFAKKPLLLKEMLRIRNEFRCKKSLYGTLCFYVSVVMRTESANEEKRRTGFWIPESRSPPHLDSVSGNNNNTAGVYNHMDVTINVICEFIW